ncbi:MAG: hypothetical protein K2J75_01705 [Clostridia bacterium]|nr:hypothetical protein [Clostridia bacterium]
MKSRKFYLFTLICAVLFILIFATACNPDGILSSPSQSSNEYLKNCDFSFSNVSELVIVIGCPPKTYSIKKGQSAEDDEVILQVLEHWIAFQQQAVFNDNIYGLDHAVVGGGSEFKCIFQDGSSIEIGYDHCTNYVVNDFGACQLENRDVDKEFNEIAEIMRKAKYLTHYYGDFPPYSPID